MFLSDRPDQQKNHHLLQVDPSNLPGGPPYDPYK